MSPATEIKSRKRKSAPEPTVAAKKTKVTAKAAEPEKKTKVAAKAAETTKPKSALKKTVSHTIVKDAPATGEKPAKLSRKEKLALAEKAAAEAGVEVPVGKGKKSKKAKGSATTKDDDETKETGKSARAARPVRPAKQEEKIIKALAEAEVNDEEAEEDVIDDQTAALLAGFESSEDENDPEDNGIPLEKIPDIPDNPEMKKAIKAAETDEEHTPGVLYIGRIPHGFFEHQMRAYFSQFGTITHLRLSRNKVTGHPKHFGFVEFASGAVADIVAKTMDKYLMFGHILQVRRIPAEQVHASLWKGEGKRFKVMPRNKIEGGLLRRGATREVWAKRVKAEEKRRTSQAKKLKEMGYEFEMPTLKSVDDVPVQEIKAADVLVVGDSEDAPKAIESGKTEQSVVAPEVAADTTEPETTPVKRKKTAKGKAAKKAKI